MTTSLRFDAGAVAAIDAGRRTISGLVLPFNRVVEKHGVRYQFAPGSIVWPADLSRVKLLLSHIQTAAVGLAVQLQERPQGIEGVFRIGTGAEGDQVLAAAAERIVDGLSAGLDIDELDPSWTDAPGGVQLVTRARLREVSLTPMPAFDDARVTSVAASRDPEGVAVPDDVTTPPAQQAPTPQPAGLTLSTQQLAVLLADPVARTALFGAPPAAEPPPAPRQVVNPTRLAWARDREEEPQHPKQRPLLDGAQQLMPDADGIRELFEAVAERRPLRIEAAPAQVQLATVTTTQSGRNTDYLRGGIMPMPLRIADMVGLSTEEVGWGGSSSFPKFGAGAAGVAAEGAAKTQYDAVTAGTATPATINAWTDITGQVGSLANFEARLRNKLARLIAVEENNQLRVAAAAGATAQAFTAGDQAVQILRAAATIEASVGVRPDLMLFNPADTVAIFGTAVSNAAPQEIRELSMRVFGMAALPMTSQPAGFALVGAWQASSTLVVGSRLVYLVDPYTQMKSNVVTILAEEAVALAVHEAPGFTSVDIVTP